jgi:hypothetical protein
MTKFTATESSSAPIVLAKEPVLIPAGIIRGEINTVLMPGDIMHGGDIFNGGFKTVSFVTRSTCDRFRITYHHARVIAFAPEFKEIKAMIDPETVITWEPVQ